MKADIGDKIHIDFMAGEPQYADREGIVKSIDDMGYLHGTWGGCAIIPDTDVYHIVKDKE